MVTERVARGGISAGLVRLLAVAVATTVANLYYAQPLLNFRVLRPCFGQVQIL